MRNRSQQGMTLIELLVALVIVAILLGIGVPSFVAAARNSQLSAQHSQLISSLLLARSEAVKNGTPVTVCARGSGERCGEDWTRGWIVFIDGGTVAQIDESDTIVAVSTVTGSERTIRALASSDGAAISASDRHFIRYSSSGSSDWANGSFVLCDGRHERYARAVNVVLTGDIRRSRRTAESDVPLNAFGLPISCSIA